MHPSALKNIEEGIGKALNSCYIENGLPDIDSYANTLLSTSKQLIKDKKEWLSIGDIFSIFFDEIEFVLFKKFSNEDIDKSGQLIELIGEEKNQELLKSIIAYIDSIPRTYHICFPIACADIGEKVIKLNDTSYIKTLEIPQIPKLGTLASSLGLMNGSQRSLLKPAPKPKMPHICFREKGYVKYSIEDSAVREALSKFKQLIHFGVIKQIFIEKEDAIFETILGDEWRKQNSSVAIVFEEKTDLVRQMPVKLPIGIVKNMQCLNISKVDLLIGLLKVISNTHQDDDVMPIKTALEWAFEASINDNETISFIQTSIGLEAILGDNIDEESLTKKLADRCAYILGRTFKQRNEIREKFKDFYALRSNLVHGRKFRLDDDRRKLLYWGKRTLDKIISEEASKYLSYIKE